MVIDKINLVVLIRVALNERHHIGIGKRIRNKREYMQFTREQLAEMAEISPQFLADIENGKKGMSFSTLVKLCSVLGTSCDYIILGKVTSVTNSSELLDMIQSIDKKISSFGRRTASDFYQNNIQSKRILNSSQKEYGSQPAILFDYSCYSAVSPASDVLSTLGASPAFSTPFRDRTVLLCSPSLYSIVTSSPTIVSDNVYEIHHGYIEDVI